jgi:DNA polymerase III subunit epsilon
VERNELRASGGRLGPLAFVDVETTGLSPVEDRIAEIGVVAVDGNRVERWTSLVKTSSRREWTFPDGIGLERLASAPLFRDVAAELAQRLAGRLLIAHNARFDHAFLKAEFDRVGVPFHPEVLCSVALSRKLDPQLAHHDLDSLVASHGLQAQTRHRALPDADLVWQWWQAAHESHSGDAIAKAIATILEGPVLPPELDPSLIDRLPEMPGAYVLLGEDDQPLVVGAAANLKRHILGYFRVDQATDKALEYSHRVANITWRVTRGLLGAQLHATALAGALFQDGSRRSGSAALTCRFSPDAAPSVAIVSLDDGGVSPTADSFGIFPSERRARNALARLATKHRLCHFLLGLSRETMAPCHACPVDRPGAACVGKVDRKKQLLRIFAALEPLRLPAWPHRGPVGIRERSDIHVVDHWQFLGTAQSEGEVYGLLENHQRAFDRRFHRLLNRTLAQLPRSKIVDLSRYTDSAECSAGVPPDIQY